MTALFRGGEMEAFVPSGSGVTESATGTFNASFSRCAITLVGTVSVPDAAYMDSASWSAQTGDLFLHFEQATTGSAVTTHSVQSLVSGSTENVRIRRTNLSGGVHTWQVQYLNAGAVWTAVGSSITLLGGRTDYDLYANITTGEIALFVRGSATAAAATGLSLGHMSGFTKARSYSDFPYRSISQVMVDTVSTIGRRLATAYPSGVGSDTAWTGSYTEVDEIVLNDADFINSGTANQVETYSPTVASLTGYVVRDVTVSTRGKRGTGGPQNMRHALRSAGTNYFSGSDIALGVGYTPQQTIWETDPATSAAWVNTAISSIQAGVKSIT